MTDLSEREILLELRGDVKDIRRQTTLTNGRVTALEAWRHEQEIAQAEERGRSGAGAVITKGQLTILGTVMTLLGGAAGLVARFM